MWCVIGWKRPDEDVWRWVMKRTIFVPCWTERDVEPLIWRRVFVSVLLFKNLSSCWWKPNTRLKGCGRVICNSRCMGGGCWRQLQSAFLPPWSSAAETATWQTCLFLLLPTFKRPLCARHQSQSILHSQSWGRGSKAASHQWIKSWKPRAAFWHPTQR